MLIRCSLMLAIRFLNLLDRCCELDTSMRHSRYFELRRRGSWKIGLDFRLGDRGKRDAGFDFRFGGIGSS
jgi:hypothetical protein